MDPLSGIEQKKEPNLTNLQDNQTNKLPKQHKSQKKKHALKHKQKKQKSLQLSQSKCVHIFIITTWRDRKNS